MLESASEVSREGLGAGLGVSLVGSFLGVSFFFSCFLGTSGTETSSLLS